MGFRFAVTLVFFIPLICFGAKVQPKKHYPVQNPQGIDFEADGQFVVSYKRHLATKLKEQRKLESARSTSSWSAIPTYNIKDTKGLQSFDPKDAGWDKDYIAPPKSKASKVAGYLKEKFADLFSKKKSRNNFGKPFTSKDNNSFSAFYKKRFDNEDKGQFKKRQDKSSSKNTFDAVNGCRKYKNQLYKLKDGNLCDCVCTASDVKNTQISRKNNAKNFDSYKNKGATECKNDKSFQVTAKEACVAERKLKTALREEKIANVQKGNATKLNTKSQTASNSDLNKKNDLKNNVVVKANNKKTDANKKKNRVARSEKTSDLKNKDKSQITSKTKD